MYNFWGWIDVPGNCTPLFRTYILGVQLCGPETVPLFSNFHFRGTTLHFQNCTPLFRICILGVQLCRPDRCASELYKLFSVLKFCRTTLRSRKKGLPLLASAHSELNLILFKIHRSASLSLTIPSDGRHPTLNKILKIWTYYSHVSSF
jgi:hypothetical protein